MNQLAFWISVLISTASFAQAQTQISAAVGFASGNNFSAVPIQGEVRVFCNGDEGLSNAIFTCRDVVLDPKAYDYFIGPQDGRADQVELTATREDGSRRTKNEDYVGSTGRSEDSINLWISTLFQKPLLQLGSNDIQYKIYSGRNAAKPYAQGNFRVSVARGAARTCPAATYQSSQMSDCTSQYSICQRYFDEFKNCR